jgi:oxygen-dependent protoporphyrinogen oxidase
MAVVQPHIVVVGAGMAGLSAARELQRAGANVTVLEQAAEPGGRVQTHSIDGFEIDIGAQFIAGFYDRTLRLIRELDLQGELIHIPSSWAIMRAGRPQPVWPDLRLALTGLLSLRAKLRLLRSVGPMSRYWRSLDVHDFAQAWRVDVRSIAEYAKTQLSDEVLEYLIEPALAGLFYWEADRTSQAMLFLLLKHGIGMRIYTLRHGLGQLVRALAANATVQTNCCVLAVRPTADGRYALEVRDPDRQTQLLADGVVCAVPATTVGRIVQGLTAVQLAFFASITYSATWGAAIGVSRRFPSTYYSLFLPQRDGAALGAVTIQSVKNPAQLPDGCDLIGIYASGTASRRLLRQPNPSPGELLGTDLRRLGYAFEEHTLVSHIFAWPEALPEFDVGHLQRLHRFAVDQIETGRLVFAGDYLGGPLIEGAITSGQAAAKRLLARLGVPA